MRSFCVCPSGVPERIRTADLPLRRRTLYPAELRKHLFYPTTHRAKIQPRTAKSRRFFVAGAPDPPPGTCRRARTFAGGGQPPHPVTRHLLCARVCVGATIGRPLLPLIPPSGHPPCFSVTLRLNIRPHLLPCAFLPQVSSPALSSPAPVAPSALRVHPRGICCMCRGDHRSPAAIRGRKTGSRSKESVRAARGKSHSSLHPARPHLPACPRHPPTAAPKIYEQTVNYCTRA